MSNHNAAERPPNIVVLISHDLGCHIGPYGFVAERTPALNQLASESLRLDRFFVSSPGCSQSRFSFVTGRYHHANGQFGLANWGWKLNEDEQLLPEVLRNHGYQTTLFGIWHLHEWTLEAFDTISDDVSTLDSSPEGYAEIASDRAADWLQQRGQDKKPFTCMSDSGRCIDPFANRARQILRPKKLSWSKPCFPTICPITRRLVGSS